MSFKIHKIHSLLDPDLFFFFFFHLQRFAGAGRGASMSALSLNNEKVMSNKTEKTTTYAAEMAVLWGGGGAVSGTFECIIFKVP